MSEQEEKVVIPTDEKLNEVLVGSTWVERDDVGLRDRTWEDTNEEERSFAREWVKGMLFSREAVEMIGAYMDEKEKAIAKSPLLAAVEEFGVPLTEAEREEAKERYGNWQDDVLTPVEWWKDEKGEI